MPRTPSLKSFFWFLFVLTISGLVLPVAFAAPMSQNVVNAHEYLITEDTSVSAQLMSTSVSNDITPYLRAYADGAVLVDLFVYNIVEPTEVTLNLSVNTGAAETVTKTITAQPGTYRLKKVIDVDWGADVEKNDVVSSTATWNGNSRTVDAVILSSPVFMTVVPCDSTDPKQCGVVIVGHTDPDVQIFMNDQLVHEGYYPQEDWETPFIEYPENAPLVNITAIATLDGKLRAKLSLGVWNNNCYTYIPPEETPEPTETPPSTVTPTPTLPPPPTPTTPPADEDECVLKPGFKLINGKCVFTVYLPAVAGPDKQPTQPPDETPCVPSMYGTYVNHEGREIRLEFGMKWVDPNDFAGQTTLYDGLQVKLHITCADQVVFYSFFPDAAQGLPQDAILDTLVQDATYMYVLRADGELIIDMLRPGRYGFSIRPVDHSPNWHNQVDFEINIQDAE